MAGRHPTVLENCEHPGPQTSHIFLEVREAKDFFKLCNLQSGIVGLALEALRFSRVDTLAFEETTAGRILHTFIRFSRRHCRLPIGAPLRI